MEYFLHGHHLAASIPSYPPFLVNGIKIHPSGESRDGGESEIAHPPSDQKNQNSIFFSK